MSGRILVLDDEENYARMVHDLLRQERYQVEMATRPEDALKALREKHYDLVVSDYKMPFMDGSQFLDEARKIREDLPVIMVSGLMNTPELIKVANIGVTLVLEKPFDTEVFLKHVSTFVQPLPEGVALEGGPDESAVESGRPAARATVKTYPKDLSYMVDASPASQAALQRVWDSLKAGSHAFVEAPRGCEFEMLLREVSAWKGYDRKRIHTFSAIQLKSGAVLDALGQVADDPSSSKVVGITDWDETIGDQQAFLLQFVRQTVQVAPKTKSVIFLHRICNGEFLAGQEQAEAQELIQVLAGRLIPLPPLAERRADQAAYVSQWLPIFAHMEKRPGKAKLSAEAVRLLMHHPLPGNFNQLIDILRKAVQLGDDACTHADDLRSVFARYPENWDGDPAGMDLAGVLLARQKAYLAAVKREVESEDDAVALQLAKVPQERIGDDPAAAAAKLLFPELVEKV